MPQGHRPYREGIIAGIIGATGVAAWFLMVDVVSHHGILYTPRLLGTALFSVFGNTTNDGLLVHIVVYTIFHYGVFIVGGVISSFVVHKAAEEPSVLVIFMLLFIIFELGVTGVAAMMAEGQLHALAWYQVAIGNLLAAGLMGVYLWRTHPALKQEFAHAMGGDE